MEIFRGRCGVGLKGPLKRDGYRNDLDPFESSSEMQRKQQSVKRQQTFNSQSSHVLDSSHCGNGLYVGGGWKGEKNPTGQVVQG